MLYTLNDNTHRPLGSVTSSRPPIWYWHKLKCLSCYDRYFQGIQYDVLWVELFTLCPGTRHGVNPMTNLSIPDRSIPYTLLGSQQIVANFNSKFINSNSSFLNLNKQFGNWNCPPIWELNLPYVCLRHTAKEHQPRETNPNTWAWARLELTARRFAVQWSNHWVILQCLQSILEFFSVMKKLHLLIRILI